MIIRFFSSKRAASRIFRSAVSCRDIHSFLLPLSMFSFYTVASMPNLYQCEVTPVDVVSNSETEHRKIPFTFQILNTLRILMLLLFSGTYFFYGDGPTEWQQVYIIIAMCLFVINHFARCVSSNRYFLWCTALDFLLATGFGVAFLGLGYPYELFYGIIGVTLLIGTDNKRILYVAAGLLVLVWSAILWMEISLMGSVHFLNTAINFGFVIFSALVGSLIRYFMLSRQKVGELYERLEESHQALREYAKQVEVLTAISERNHIAREIHDTVGHSMTALLVQLQAARKLQARDLELSEQALMRCEELARSALQQVRLSVRALREEEAQPISLVESVRQLLADFAEMTGVQTELQAQGQFSAVPESLKPIIYRIVQESLTNAKRHGNASSAVVRIKSSEQEVLIVIEDDGQGVAEVVPGFGLINLRERVMELGGTVLFITQSGSGFRTEVCFPLKEQSWKFGGGGA